MSHKMWFPTLHLVVFFRGQFYQLAKHNKTTIYYKQDAFGSESCYPNTTTWLGSKPFLPLHSEVFCSCKPTIGIKPSIFRLLYCCHIHWIDLIFHFEKFQAHRIGLWCFKGKRRQTVVTIDVWKNVVFCFVNFIFITCRNVNINQYEEIKISACVHPLLTLSNQDFKFSGDEVLTFS